VEAGPQGRTPRPFEVIATSFPGSEHIAGSLQGNGNQDSFGYREVEKGFIAVTCDGCGETPDGSTGARAAVRIVLNICEEILASELIPAADFFAETLQRKLLDRIRAAAQPLARPADQASLNDVLYQSFLFTINVAVITADWTAIIGCGDGYYAVNGTVETLKPREGNKPEYLSYLLMNPVPDGFEGLKMGVRRRLDTKDLRSLMIGTDGLSPIVGKTQGGFELADLWRERKFRQPQEMSAALDGLKPGRPKLVIRQRGDDEASVWIDTNTGVFSDDTTFVVVVREFSEQLPEAWRRYRDKYVAPPPPKPQPVAVPAASAAGTPAATTACPTAPAGTSPPAGPKAAPPEPKATVTLPHGTRRASRWPRTLGEWISYFWTNFWYLVTQAGDPWLPPEDKAQTPSGREARDKLQRRLKEDERSRRPGRDDRGRHGKSGREGRHEKDDD